MLKIVRCLFQLVSKQLVGMLIIVLIRNELYVHASSITSASVGVGLLNTLGNKGGVALRFRVHDTMFCFVASHLAAFDEMVEKRNSDYRELTRRITFPLINDPSEQSTEKTFASVFDCDCLFWMVSTGWTCALPRVDHCSPSGRLATSSYIQ